jgi:hypothetical protein
MGFSFKVAPGFAFGPPVGESAPVRTPTRSPPMPWPPSLDARRVVIRRGDPDHEVVVADVGKPEAPFGMDHLTHLDADGHILPAGRGQPPTGPAVRWVRAPEGAVLELLRQRRRSAG